MRILKSYRLALLTFNNSRRLVYWPDALLSVGAAGDIVFAGPAPKKVSKGTADLRGSLAIPGLIDAHCHLSQYPAVAADGLELLPWLRKNIFPLENRFRGESARPLARRFFAELAAHGTTCAAVYTSIWKDSTQVCFEEALASGMRVIMGKVMMDRHSYDQGFFKKHPGEKRSDVSLKQSEELCRLWHKRGDGRILYAFTPRFALSCSAELMAKTAELAARYGAYVQTHLSENQNEVREVERTFPRDRDYTSVYDRAGLIGPRTILAHCIWLKEAEYSLLSKKRPAVAHCPTSNAFLSSGIMNMGRMLKGDIPVALGSDVAAGPSLCLFSVMRQAIYSQRLARAHGVFNDSIALAPEDVFYMATLGGATALRLGDRIGSLEKGKQADFVVINPKMYSPMPLPALRPKAADVLSQLVYRGERAAVAAAYVAGRRVSA